MRVAVYYNNRDLRLEERPVPKVGKGELLLKVVACGICGSDVMEWYRVPKAPLVLGHEVTAIVEKVGGGVAKYEKGQRVFATHHVPCNTCRYCLRGQHTLCDTLRSTNFDPGGFAEYLRVPALNVDRGLCALPESVSFEEGVFVEPLGCVLRSTRAAELVPGSTVLVLGTGVAGILYIQVAKVMGAAVVLGADIAEYRVRAAEKFGADGVLLATSAGFLREVRKHLDGALPDCVVVCTAAIDALKQAFACAERGAMVHLFAPPAPGTKLPIDFNGLWLRGIKFSTSYAATLPELQGALELIARRKVNVREMVTHVLPLEQIARGFALVAAARECLKVVVKPAGELSAPSS
jgi:L-iditol 2-dehydrogenase